MLGSSILATVGSLIAGGAVAAVTIVGLVTSQTAAPDNSPADVTKSVNIDYGSNG